MVGRLNLRNVCDEDLLEMNLKAERLLDSPDSGLPPSPSVSPSPWLSADRSGDRSASRSADRSASRSADRSASRSASRSGDRSASRSASRSADRSASRSGDRSASRSADRSGDRSASRSADRSADRSASRSADRSASRSASRSADRSASRSADRSADRSASSSVCEDVSRAAGPLKLVRGVSQLHPFSYGEGIELDPLPPKELRYTSSVRYDSDRHYIQDVCLQPTGLGLELCSQTIIAVSESTWRRYKTQLEFEPRQRVQRYRSTTIVYPKHARTLYTTHLSYDGRKLAKRFLSSVELEVSDCKANQC